MSAMSIYQIRITLRHSKPPIWRRVLVRSDITLGKLHDIIQAVMGWADYHLHQFTVDGIRYSVPSPEDWEPVNDERQIRLDRIVPGEGTKFLYEYDFGDSWQHVLLVEKILPMEKILPPEQGGVYPLCVTGRRACPPEDVGGIWRYYGFLEALQDPDHPEHETYVEWIGDEFDPEPFDLDQANAALQGLR